MDQFHLVRSEDVSGISGTGVVAKGVRLPSGKIALEWCTEITPTIGIYDNIEIVEQVHGHGGKTVVRWIDKAEQEAERKQNRQEIVWVILVLVALFLGLGLGILLGAN